MHQRNKNASIFRHLVGTGLSRPLSIAMPLIRCGMQSGNPTGRQGQLKLRVSENFSAYLTSFSKFGLFAYRLAWPPPKLLYKHKLSTSLIKRSSKLNLSKHTKNIFFKNIFWFNRRLLTKDAIIIDRKWSQIFCTIIIIYSFSNWYQMTE